MEDLDVLTSMALLLGVALLAGFVANRLRLPVILGYLISGVLIGPHVLQLVKDVDEVEMLATIGVVLLMFTVGLEFSLRTLRRIARIAIIGGLGQVAATAAFGFGVGSLMGWSGVESILFGFLIALSSTTIVLKTLMDRGELGSPHGRIMAGILLIQDLSVIPMMAIVPALGSTGGELLEDIGWGLGKAAMFLVVILALGFWGLPWLMRVVAGQRSRELFLLTVVCLTLGAGFAAHHLGLSVALGAFLAGLLVSESEYAYQALADIRPLRDVFAVLFFSALGMLADPSFIADHPAEVAAVVVVVIAGKWVISAMIPWIYGFGRKTTAFVGSGLFQIGEFSFVLAALAMDEGLISEDEPYLYNMILATAFITILLTPFALSLTSRAYYRLTQKETAKGAVQLRESDPGEDEAEGRLVNHTVVCGYGRVARYLGRVLETRGFSYLVIDIDPWAIDMARAKGIPYIYGDASNPEVLAKAGLEKARVLVVAFPDPIASRLVARNAREINRRLDIVVRVEGDVDTESLRELGVAEMVRSDLEAGLEIVRHTLHRFGLTPQEIQFMLNRLRDEEV